MPHGRVATRAHRAPDIWLSRVAEQGHGAEPFTPVTQAQAMDEVLIMGLRLAEGVPLDRITKFSGSHYSEVLDPKRLEKLVAGGFLTLNDRTLTATSAGRQRLNAVLSALLV